MLQEGGCTRTCSWVGAVSPPSRRGQNLRGATTPLLVLNLVLVASSICRHEGVW